MKAIVTLSSSCMDASKGGAASPGAQKSSASLATSFLGTSRFLNSLLRMVDGVRKTLVASLKPSNETTPSVNASASHTPEVDPKIQAVMREVVRAHHKRNTHVRQGKEGIARLIAEVGRADEHSMEALSALAGVVHRLDATLLSQACKAVRTLLSSSQKPSYIFPNDIRALYREAFARRDNPVIFNHLCRVVWLATSTHSQSERAMEVIRHNSDLFLPVIEQMITRSDKVQWKVVASSIANSHHESALSNLKKLKISLLPKE